MTTAVLNAPARASLIPIAGASIAFYLPLSVVPLFAERHGGAPGTAGLATVALLLATVACELATPKLIARVGYRRAVAIGLILLGAPTLVLTLDASTATILLVSMLRGAGFAISAVATNAVTATLIPPDRREKGLALAGLASGLPSLFALPAGVWAALHWGFTPVFVAATVAPLLGLFALPAGIEAAGTEAGRRRVPLAPAALFAVSTAAVGVLVTFLPLALTGHPAWVTAAALFVQPAASTAARWAAGRFRSSKLLTPGVALSAAGMAALALTGSPSAVIGGALVFGIGFGLLQNATLALMYARTPPGGESSVSAAWNAAYDLGMAAGALGAGLVVAPIGYPATFALTAAVMLPALFLTRR